MNRAFKVAKSLTRGVVVTSEKASSYQGKAVKTVVAAAVASLVAGAAMAATTVTDIKLGADGALVKDSTNVTAAVTGTATVTYKDGEKDKTDKWDAEKYSHTGTTTVTLDGGKIVVDATGYTDSQDFTMGKGSVTGNGTIAVTAGTKAAKLFLDKNSDGTGGALTLKKADITLAGTTAAAALEAGSTVTIDEGSLNFTIAGDAKTGTGSLISGGAITLGKAADDENAATAVAINVAKDVTAKISSDGELELKNAAFANAGKLTLKGSEIALDSDFDDSTNAGTTVFDGATTLSKNFTGSVVEMADADKAAKDAKQVFTGNVTVGAGAAFAADKLTISKASELEIAGVDPTANKAAGSLNVSEAIVKAGTEHSFSGTETFGKLTIGDAAAATPTAAKITVEAGTLDVSDTLTVKGNHSSNGTATLELTGGVTTLKTASIGDFGVLSVNGTAKLNVTDTLTVAGSANKAAAVTLAGENAAIANLVVNANGTVTASSGDKDLTITNLTVGNGGSFTVAGSYAMVEKLSVAKADTANSKAAGTFALTSGTLETTGDQIFTVDNTKTTLADKLSLKDGLTTDSFTGGELVLVDETYNGKAIQYTLSDWQTVKAELGTSTDLVLLYGTLVGATGDDGVTAKASFNEAQAVGYTGKSAVLWKYGKADAEATVSGKHLTVGSIEFTKADNYTGNLDSVSIKAGSNKTVSLLSDADQQVFIGALDKDGKPVAITLENAEDSTDGSFAFGDEGDYDNVGVVTNKVIAKTGVTVYDDFTFDAVELDGGFITVAGRMAAKDITSKAAEVTTVQESGTLVLAGTAADPKKGEFGQQVAANVTIGGAEEGNPTAQNGALFVVGTADDEKAAQVYQAAHHLDNTLWVGQAVKFNGSVSFAQQNASGTWNGHDGASGEKTVAIDLAALAKSGYKHSDKAVITGLNDTPEKLVLANLQQVSKDTLGYNDYRKQYFLNVGTNLLQATPDNAREGRVDFGTEFYQASAANVINGNAYFVVDEDTVKEVKALGLNSFGAVESAVRNLEFGQNEIADTVIFDLYGSMSTNAYLLAADEAYDKYREELQKAGKYPTDAVAQDKLEQEFYAPYVAELVKAEHAATNMAALGGAFTTALDINDQVTAAVSRRTSAQRAEGFTPWVDVFGTTNEAKRLYGNGAGYEADIYGAVLGFDYTAACGGTLGVAFNVGQADGNSVGSGAKVDNDADFYGVSLYGAQTFGDFNVKADLGYTQVSNDLSTNNVLGSYKESLDANVFTFGLGTEYLAKFGALNVTPHAGIRLSRIDMDDSKYGADYDAMTVYQLPLGVAFSGNFDVNGWKLAPMVDLSVVPAFGDKDAVATYTGGIQNVTRVVDTNPIQATLGVSAQNGAWTFGLNYGLTAGGDDRMNNAFNANLRYSF